MPFVTEATFIVIASLSEAKAWQSLRLLRVLTHSRNDNGETSLRASRKASVACPPKAGLANDTWQ